MRAHFGPWHDVCPCFYSPAAGQGKSPVEAWGEEVNEE